MLPWWERGLELVLRLVSLVLISPFVLAYRGLDWLMSKMLP